MAEKQAVQIEMALEDLQELFNKGAINAAQFRCLNQESKLCVHDICKHSCIKKLLRQDS